MQGTAHIMMTLDIAINFWLTDSCYEVKRLRNSLKTFCGRYPDLIRKYQRSEKDMMADSFPDWLHAVAQLVLSHFLILILSLGLSLFVD